MSNKKIRNQDIFRVFLRSFFVQSMWNYRSLISAGFGICLFPIARRLYQTTESRKAFLERHLKFFNAHPYMASYALGVSIHLEEAYAAGDKTAEKKLDRMKELLAGLLGAVGDQLFWSVIKPFSLIIGVAALMIANGVLQWSIILILIFILYNAPHLYLRYSGITQGYCYGADIYKYLGENQFKFLQRYYSYFGIIAFLLFLGILITKISLESPVNLAVMIGSLVVSGAVYHYRQNYYITITITTIFSIILGILFL